MPGRTMILYFPLMVTQQKRLVNHYLQQTWQMTLMMLMLLMLLMTSVYTVLMLSSLKTWVYKVDPKELAECHVNLLNPRNVPVTTSARMAILMISHSFQKSLVPSQISASWKRMLRFCSLLDRHLLLLLVPKPKIGCGSNFHIFTQEAIFLYATATTDTFTYAANSAPCHVLLEAKNMLHIIGTLPQYRPTHWCPAVECHRYHQPSMPLQCLHPSFQALKILLETFPKVRKLNVLFVRKS